MDISKKEKQKEYYIKNKERILSYLKEYYQKNKHKKEQYFKKYYEKNRDHIIKNNQKNYIINKEDNIEKMKKYNIENDIEKRWRNKEKREIKRIKELFLKEGEREDKIKEMSLTLYFD